MKALRKTRPEFGAELVDIPIPAVGPADILIKVKAAAICGSDIHIYEWNEWAAQRIKTPMTFGHEFCAEVVQVGEQVSHLKPGDLVAGETHVPCGNCVQCWTGNQHACEKMTILGVHFDGAFSEYAVMPALLAWKLPDGTDPELGCVMEPMGVATHGLLVDPLDVGSVGIVGQGPIGILGAMVAQAQGARPLFVFEVKPERVEMARRLLPNAIVINPEKEDPVKAVHARNGGRGVDVSVELSGTAAGTRVAIDIVRMGGRLSLVGLTGEPITLNSCDDVIYKELTIKGTTGRMMWKTWMQVERLISNGMVDPRQVITDRFPLSDYAAAFDLAMSGRAGKVVLFP